MNQEIFDWILLLARWLHITVAVTWIGTSIFFMWLDRSFVVNPNAQRPGHVGDVWMVHGGGFYHVEKLLMGPTQVPERLHWFKWEAYWTWMSGMLLIVLHYYLGEGTFLLDSMVSDISFTQGILIGLFSIFGSWIIYDQLWERNFIRKTPIIGHVLTMAWLFGMTYFLSHTLSGRAAYIHIGGMLGTWMTANVFMRIIPRQLLMVEASKTGQTVNQDWAKNAKNRSTHNTYFTLPVIFLMISNHFPQTYGHEYNWLILLIVCAAGAAVREYFVVRLSNPKRSLTAAVIGISLLAGVIVFSKTSETSETVVDSQTHYHEEMKVSETVENKAPEPVTAVTPVAHAASSGKKFDVGGVVTFSGVPPKGKKLNLPAGCARPGAGDVFSNEVIVNNTRVQNVLVRVVSGHEKLGPFDIPTEEVVLDQKGCIYTPRVAGARVGQKVTFVNSDPIFHNVRSVTKNNQKFNMAMPKKNQRESKIFTKPELFLQAKCSVHPWMGAYVAIMDHPFYAVTNDKGEFSIKNLPTGHYTLEIWHEVFGTKTLEVDVTDKGASQIEVKF